MEATKSASQTRKRMSGAARRKRAILLKSGGKSTTAKPASASNERVVRLIKDVQQKKIQNSQNKLALVPVGAGKNAKPADLRNKINKKTDIKAIKSQAFQIVRQKLAESLMQILPNSDVGDGGNWNNGNDQGQWNNNNMNMNNGAASGGGGGYWSNSNNNNNQMNNVRSSNNMQSGWNDNNFDRGTQGRWNNNSNNNLNQQVINNPSNSGFNKNLNRSGPSSTGGWNTNNNMNRGGTNSSGIWSSSSNSNLNLGGMRNMPNNWNNNNNQQNLQTNMSNMSLNGMNNRSDAWNNNQQNSQINLNSNNWDNQCPVAPPPPRWNQNLADSVLGNAGLNQNLANENGGSGNWNNNWPNKWSNDPRNAGSREYFEQRSGNDNFTNLADQDEYDKSSAELKFAIMDMSMPGGKIVGKRQQVLTLAFNQALADVLLNADRRFPPIQIRFSRFIQDTFKISVATGNCAAMLQELVNRLPALWPGCKLRLVPFQEPVKLQKASLFIRSGANNRSTEDILLILGRQNAGLRTDLWHIFQRRQRDDGLLLIVGIDQQSIDSLIRCEGKIFFLTSSVAFRLGNKKLTGATANAGGNQASGNKVGGNQAGGNQTGGKQASGNQAVGKQASGNQAGVKQASGNRAGGNQSGGNQANANQASGRNRNAQRRQRNKNNNNNKNNN